MGHAPSWHMPLHGQTTDAQCRDPETSIFVVSMTCERLARASARTGLDLLWGDRVHLGAVAHYQKVKDVHWINQLAHTQSITCAW